VSPYNMAGNSFAFHYGNTRTSLPERRSSRMTHSEMTAIPRPAPTASRKLVTPSEISTGEIRMRFVVGFGSREGRFGIPICRP
jgi:hypothetical protein